MKVMKERATADNRAYLASAIAYAKIPPAGNFRYARNVQRNRGLRALKKRFINYEILLDKYETIENRKGIIQTCFINCYK
ncbi:MAG: hypothetical protein KBONHNOK_00646 [Candidatus Methanoperedenaceae archaeon GB50]|nr:MAG: hypothetical protein KBONHNOK_00646 [Candidatus Methanoperedenaceae archaeon GB50]